jgi:phosphoribosyl 1,2-cyclic phosphodiesterase
MALRVRFWGVRGSVPWAAADCIGYGGNTACIEVRDDRSGALLVLDAGTGIVRLGESLHEPPGDIPILLTHYHWDHVHGLPLFRPLHVPGWRPLVAGPRLGSVAPDWIESLFKAPFFPRTLADLPSRPRVSIFDPGDMEIGGFRLRMHRLNHPGGSLAYRIGGDSGDLVFATDHECGDSRRDGDLAAFAFNAGAIVLDGQLTPEESALKKGPGHSNWRQCAELASAASAGHLWLFHHQPGRTDAEVKVIESRARHIFPATSAAREGEVFTI